jgi:hypothetical protein
MPRRSVGAAGVAVAFVLAVLTACTSSGTHPQSFSPTSSIPTSTTATNSASASSSNTSASRSIAPPIPAPTVTPPAQDAVNAYIAFYNAMTAADQDPAHANVAKIDSYLTGKARTLFDGVLANQKKSGTAYRGTPPIPRVKVETIFSSTFMFLTSCPLESATDPFVEFDLSTGKPVPVTKPTIPPPYQLKLSMQKVNGGWKLADLLVDSRKTCKA